MFQNNPLLAQLKQQFKDVKERITGTIKATDKSYGFLEAENQKNYYIPAQQMELVMHGDKVSAVVHEKEGKQFAELETLVKASLSRFVGHVQLIDKQLAVVPYHNFIHTSFRVTVTSELQCHEWQEGDWVIAVMQSHPLVNGTDFHAEITEFIAHHEDKFVPWKVTLAFHQLEKDPPKFNLNTQLKPNDNAVRQNLSHLPFFTIDNDTTKDIDDALYLEQSENGGILLWVAITDATAYFQPGDEIDQSALHRAYTLYLPGLSIPMLPNELTHSASSLLPNKKRPVLVCKIEIDSQGNILSNYQFLLADICSQEKLTYNNVSNWLENIGEWRPTLPAVAEQLKLLLEFSQLRIQWRTEYTFVPQYSDDYRFVISAEGEIKGICTERRRTAHKMIEEAMITANICGSLQLNNYPGYGIFNTHSGFDPNKLKRVTKILQDNNLEYSEEKLSLLEGFCQLYRDVIQKQSTYLDRQLRRYQNHADISEYAAPHYGMGLKQYVTWTSPLRKYGDIINHRLLKASILKVVAPIPEKQVIQHLLDRRRQQRFAERSVFSWLYCIHLQSTPQQMGVPYRAEVIEINRGGMRVSLLDNGAVVFIPIKSIHPVRNEIKCHTEAGIIDILKQKAFCLGDEVMVTINEIKMVGCSIIGDLFPSKT